MQEQETKDTPKNEKPSDLEIIRTTGEEMQSFALEHPILTHEAHVELSRSGEFSKVIPAGKMIALHVRLTISPSDEETVIPPHWHLSMSLISLGSGKPKTYQLWMKRERTFAVWVMPQFLGERGVISTQYFSNTKTALHCYRDLSANELKTIGWKSNF